MASNEGNQYLAQELLDVQRTLGWMDLVIGSISDAVYVTDEQSRFVFANQCFSDLVGVHRVFLLGKVAQEVFKLTPLLQVPDEYKQGENMQLSFVDGDDGIYEWIGPDAKRHIFKMTVKKLTVTRETVFLVQDITREYELTRMKTEFINLASHQLRTPMTAIMTYSHLLRDGFAGDLDGKQQELADTVVHASERMIRLVNDLLTITRVQSDRSNVDKAAVSLKQVFSRIHDELEPRVVDKKISLKINLPSNLQAACGDGGALHEIFSNLIVNSIQYTHEGGKIEVTAKNAGDKIKVTVKDTGIGIPSEDQPRLFSQFTRADNALEAYPEGTGLGLYVIKILLEKVEGSISFKSELGKGTAFTVTMPGSSPD